MAKSIKEMKNMDLERINKYIENLYKDKEELNRKKFQDETELKDFIPVVDDDVARFLKLIITISSSRDILEIGTSIGYSATSMAQILKKYKGHITTIEFDEAVAKQAKENFIKSGVADIIDIKIGDAKVIIPGLNKKYDLIFQDVDKRLYPVLFDDCIKLLKPGGILVADDTLFPVIDLDPKWHYLIPAIEEFNKLVMTDDRIESTILPIGDGVTIALKKQMNITV
jgi:predicted O-methyltransferase YrrM